jgi:LPS-assembly protein
LQYRPDGERVINLGYRAQRDRLEQTELSGAWPIGKHWNAYARAVYSLRDEQMLERFAGFEYRACCWRVRAVARRSVSNREGTQESSFYIQLELKALPVSEMPTLSWNTQFEDTRRKLPPSENQLHDS